MTAESVILVVDDNEDDVILFRYALRKNNFFFRVHVAKNGQEAIAYLMGEGEFADREKYPFPNLILTDSRMPKMSGFDFLRWLQAHPECKVIPTVFFGGAGTSEEVKEAYQLGVHSYIAKPVHAGELEKIVAIIFRYWEICSVPPSDETSVECQKSFRSDS